MEVETIEAKARALVAGLDLVTAGSEETETETGGTPSEGRTCMLNLSLSRGTVKTKEAGSHVTEFERRGLDLSNESAVKAVLQSRVHSTNLWNGTCSAAAYCGMTGLTLDVDKSWTISEARERFKEHTYLIYTTTNHLKDGVTERFRIILPFAQTSYQSKEEADAAFAYVKSKVPECDPTVLARHSKFYPYCGEEERFEVYVNQGRFFEIPKQEIEQQKKEVAKSKKISKSFRRPDPLTEKDTFVLVDKKTKLALSEVKLRLRGQKGKLPIYCPRCNDLESATPSAVIEFNKQKVLSLHCAHCSAEKDGIGGRGLYLEATKPLPHNTFVYRRTLETRTPYWVSKDEEGFWSTKNTSQQRVWEAGYDPETIPFFENFIFDANLPDGEIGIEDRGAVIFNAYVRTKYLPLVKPERTIEPDKALALIKERCPTIYLAFHNIIGEEQVESWMTQWFGNLLDHNQNHCVPVIAGEGGTGKSFFFESIIGRILGDALVYSTEGDKWADRFVSNRAATAWLELVNEVRITKQTEELAKGMVTAPLLRIERKGVDAIDVLNQRSYAFTTNRGDAVKMEARARRYVVCYPPGGGVGIERLVKSTGLTHAQFHAKEESELYAFAEILESTTYCEMDLRMPPFSTHAKSAMARATESRIRTLYNMLLGRDEEHIQNFLTTARELSNYKDLEPKVATYYRKLVSAPDDAQPMPPEKQILASLSPEEQDEDSNDELECIVRAFLKQHAVPNFLRKVLAASLGATPKLLIDQARDDLALVDLISFDASVRVKGSDLVLRCTVAHPGLENSEKYQ